MIARIWHGYTKPEHADAYEAMLKPELLPGISKVKGYKGSYLLRRDAGAEVEFITIMLWDSIAEIRAVAGKDYETAVIAEERRKYLLRYDAKSAHYEIETTGISGNLSVIFSNSLSSIDSNRPQSTSWNSSPTGPVVSCVGFRSRLRKNPVFSSRAYKFIAVRSR
jgi:heme-degrading monooxygenase HmoA